jgi:6-phosphofructokinase 1
MGAAAVDALLDNQKCIMIGVANDKIVHVPLNKTVKMHKAVDRELIELAEDIATFEPTE